MIDPGRRRFFTSILSAGAGVAAALVTGRARAEDAPAAGGDGTITGVCLYVPGLGKARDFVDAMSRNAPGKWTAHALPGPLTDCYFEARSRYEAARGKVNTFVGVVDAATFTLVHEAIVDGGGSFHYVTYEERNRVIFSAQV